jgi:hypothetical protein
MFSQISYMYFAKTIFHNKAYSTFFSNKIKSTRASNPLQHPTTTTNFGHNQTPTTTNGDHDIQTSTYPNQTHHCCLKLAKFASLFTFVDATRLLVPLEACQICLSERLDEMKMKEKGKGKDMKVRGTERQREACKSIGVMEVKEIKRECKIIFYCG